MSTLRVVPLLLLLLAAACSTEEHSEGLPTCDAIEEAVAKCAPDAVEEGSCTQATREAFAGFDGEIDCEQLEKSDFGCGPCEYSCGIFACCAADYGIPDEHLPNESDWDIVDMIDAFALQPGGIGPEFATASQLELGHSWSYSKSVVAAPGRSPETLAFQYSLGLLDISFDDLQEIMPAADWGINLRHHLGGEVVPFAADSKGNARQLERMVLSNLPFDIPVPLLNNDMTKVEVIVKRQDGVRVYWRVLGSVNESTITDVGYVDFAKWSEEQSIVTFHSGHRLNAAGSIEIHNDVLQPLLRHTFKDFIHGYQELNPRTESICQ